MPLIERIYPKKRFIGPFMQLFHSIKDTQTYLKVQRKSIGFVPTMGALHAGHLSLIKKSKEENELSVCSIFVNPTQFNNPEDLKKYPRTLDSDCSMLAQAGCDVVFAPSAEEMYPNLPTMKMDFGSLEHIMEGEFRPGHFNGVGIVVAKLFHIVQPNKAYFGMKDIQQVAVIRRMVHDLSFDLEIIPCPTLREPDGLAMSSRNMRLPPDERALAPAVYKALSIAQEMLLAGESIKATKTAIYTYFNNFSAFKIEYFEVCDFDSLEALTVFDPSKKAALCIAIFLGGVRLIDNIVIP